MSNNNTLRIFVPEWVPVSNKGEEAIVLGYTDTLFPNKKVIPVVLDMEADSFYEKDGIEVYPGKYFYPKWENREFGLAWSWYRIESSILSVCRHLLDKIFPSWILWKTNPGRKLERTIKHFQSGKTPSTQYEKYIYSILSCNYIIAGHNGGLNIRVCQLLILLKKYGFSYGIYGSSLKPKMQEPRKIQIFDQALDCADFVYVRNIKALDWAQKHLKKSRNKVNLCPDPAFGMEPVSLQEIEPIIAKNHLEGYINHQLIVVTVCEPTPISRHSFLETISPEKKKLKHRILLKNLTEHILDTTNAKIVFLPHSLGPEKALDDRIVAESVISMIPKEKKQGRVFLLRDEMSGRHLKRFIGEASLLIGERIHSIIGSVKVNTPFLCIGSNADYRIHGIVESMLQAEQFRYLLDYPKKEELQALFDTIWNNLPTITEERKKINQKVLSMLDAAAADIQKRISVHENSD